MSSLAPSTSRPLREGAALLLFLALAVLHTRLWSELPTSFYAHVDAVQDVWILDWVSGHILSDPLRVFDANNFYPSRKAILLCDPLLGPAVLVLPFRLLTTNPVLLYNLAVLSVLTLAGYGFYRVGLRLSGDPAAALLAGIAIPHTAQQASHIHQLNLLTLAGYPLLLLGLVDLVCRPGPRAALATAVGFAFQAGTSGYHAFACVLLGLTAAAWGWRSFGSRRTWAWTLAAAGGAAALLAPYVLGFLQHRGEAGLTRDLGWSLARSVDLGRGLFTSQTYLWRGLMPDTQGLPLFPGAAVLGFGLFGLIRARTDEARWLRGVTAAFFLLALGPRLTLFGKHLVPLPYGWLADHVPFFAAARRPIFFAVPALMALGLLAVLGLKATGLPRRPVLLVAVLAVAAAESLAPGFPRAIRSADLPEVYRFLQARPRGGILEVPLLGRHNSRYQWWSIHHGLPIANGIAAFEPRGHRRLFQRIQREWPGKPAHQDMEEWPSVTMLKEQLPVRYLVVHEGISGYVASNVEATTRTFTLLHETREGDRVYRVSRGGRVDAQGLRRRLATEQLERGRRLWLRAHAPEPSTLTVRSNGRRLAALPVGTRPEDLYVETDRGAPDGELELVELRCEAGGPIRLEDFGVEGEEGPSLTAR